jgi:hypothetical protein
MYSSTFCGGKSSEDMNNLALILDRPLCGMFITRGWKTQGLMKFRREKNHDIKELFHVSLMVLKQKIENSLKFQLVWVDFCRFFTAKQTKLTQIRFMSWGYFLKCDDLGWNSSPSWIFKWKIDFLMEYCLFLWTIGSKTIVNSIVYSIWLNFGWWLQITATMQVGLKNAEMLWFLLEIAVWVYFNLEIYGLSRQVITE